MNKSKGKNKEKKIENKISKEVSKLRKEQNVQKKSGNKTKSQSQKSSGMKQQMGIRMSTNLSSRFETSRSNRKGGIHVSGQDLLLQIPAFTTFGFPILFSQNLTPTELVGTRLNKFCDLYEKFVFTKVKFHYVPSVPTTTAGQMVLSYDQDPSDQRPDGTTFDTVRQLMGNRSAILTQLYEPRTLNCDLRIPNDGYFTSYNNPNVTQDPRLYYQGTLLIGAGPSMAPGLSPGCLWIEYEIEFFAPAVEGATDGILAISNVYTGTSADQVITMPSTGDAIEALQSYLGIVNVNTIGLPTIDINTSTLPVPSPSSLKAVVCPPGQYTVDSSLVVRPNPLSNPYNYNNPRPMNFILWVLDSNPEIGWREATGNDPVHYVDYGSVLLQTDASEAVSSNQGKAYPVKFTWESVLKTAISLYFDDSENINMGTFWQTIGGGTDDTMYGNSWFTLIKSAFDVFLNVVNYDSNGIRGPLKKIQFQKGSPSLKKDTPLLRSLRGLPQKDQVKVKSVSENELNSTVPENWEEVEAELGQNITKWKDYLSNRNVPTKSTSVPASPRLTNRRFVEKTTT
jgi:hypothetical protein